MKNLMTWLSERRQTCSMTFRSIELAESKEWRLDGGKLKHTTGGFFSVGGITAEASDMRFGKVVQPIIFQPEIGILGFIVRETIAGSHEYEWLLQAKAEPGNQDRVQLAPTVQATHSNYTRLHGGAKTHYLSYFTGAREAKTFSDSLQSEQGTRFAGKFNCNMVRCVDERVDYKSEMFRWTSRAELKQALLEDYAVNTDARSVIVSAPWALVAAEGPFFGADRPGSFRALCRTSYCADLDPTFTEKTANSLEDARTLLGLKVELCALEALPHWTCDAEGIEGAAPSAEFSVKYYAVDAPERETPAWDQPLLQSQRVGEIMLIAQVRDGVLRVFLGFSREVGLTGGVELGPSYQSESKFVGKQRIKAYLDEAALDPEITTMQSDEGGRFMASRARYSVYLLPNGVEIVSNDTGLWATLAELEVLCRMPKMLTNEARSCISLLLGIA